jgi:zinc and cadmium transporter
MSILLWILLSTFIVSIISFIGIFTLSLKEKWMESLLVIFVALSAGVMMGSAFLNLIPEAIEANESGTFLMVLAGFSVFFLIERLLHWRHCHKRKCPVHTFAYMNLVGDGVHNFIDGLIIAAGFITDFSLGLITTFAVALHEIPQEISDFGVLVYGGFSKTRALMVNFLSALMAMAGGIIGFLFFSYVHMSVSFLLPFAAGGFIYIAASDLIPEISKYKHIRNSFIYFGVFLLGIMIIYGFNLFGLGH